MNPASGSAPVGAAGGAPFSAAPPMPPMPPGPPMGHPGGFPGATEALVTCPICQTPQTGRYCEECGYDYELAAAPQAQHQQHQQPGYGYPQAPGPLPTGPAPGNYGYPPVGAGGPVYQQPQSEPQYQQHQQPAEQQYQQHQYQPQAEHGYPPVAEQQAPPAPMEYPTSFALTPPAAPAYHEPVRSTWMAVVAADREYFTDMMARSGPEASGLFFPPYCPERRIPITGRGQLRIGRRSQHKGTVPEIDLSVPPEDPGASHQHALLAEQPDGSWVLVDQDSTNGTTINGGADPITPHTAIPLGEGDRIHIGAWTTITLIRG
ncbi:FHA domain-containing protein [Kitasatospora sp. NBC_01287]|uniref:FHA domain-containing protein n=1 Tax=Kitasatospora sp. NBC_01287 TaxID=2903573 RepID=UPI002B1E3DEE|nr:FHA domain-containing protein [Kitasatospora sp. NBC_01287]